jgi:hypothetical protein
MPPGKRRQSNATLYTLMTFVGLFIIATTAAVVYYVKAEEMRTRVESAETSLSHIASSTEENRLGDIVGDKASNQTYMGRMTELFDQVVASAIGTPVPSTNAEVKAETIDKAVTTAMTKAQPYVTSLPDPTDPNAPKVALAELVDSLVTKIQLTLEQQQASQAQIQDLQDRFADATEQWQATEEDLNATVDEYRSLVEQTQADYADLSELVEQSSEDRVAELLRQLEQEKTQSRELNQDMLKTQAELDLAHERLADALEQVNKIAPPPDSEVEAQTADGRIILVDQSAGLVTIDIGSNDRVYRGLTFSVYDNLSGIPRDGEPKAEIEVFAVEKGVSTARILSSDPRNPVATKDLVGNLIWSSNKANHFVIAGSFDLNGDDRSDRDADAKIRSLVTKWGGVTDDTVTALTDFVILGTEPRVPTQPTFETLAEDPTAQERYDQALELRQHYDEIRRQAEALYIPIFTYERFLYFTGYQSSADKPGAF